MNLLEAMRVYVAVVEHGGLSGAASEFKLGDAQVSERIDCLERYLGCRLLLCCEHDDVASTDAGVAFHACCRRTLYAVEQATGAAGAARAPVPDALDATHRGVHCTDFPPPGTAHASSHRPSP
ncbi:LysR family transcriptional regulator [Burkholderia sp. JP2-270]|uniref:helix-turn-helix domain-containing protein n=1 Tax=Burkholderia sp. JP2-270 TaxID=2217913 RepID=UPI000DA39431|nr:LysR family transcriptional regulator [Burkholderia sp. JP2-270]AWV05002.1 LysR family transcriptional regulator [Burkholderia sp. JP2-270]